tara:strand:- start:510 stop:1436 length:927 start_codon:yes stop_codon:yes gene_type:complete
MFSNKKRRRIKPFARPTSFDFNAVYDLRHYQKVKYGAKPKTGSLFPGSTSIEDFQIMEGEILMQMDEASKIRRYGDHQMHCFGFASGLNELSDTHKKKNAAVLKEVEALGKAQSPTVDMTVKAHALLQLKYAGVAVTNFKPETDIYEQGFVVTVAGLNTIFNNGEHSIYPGDIICADVPKNDGRKLNRAGAQGGIPGTKYQFTVTPYETLAEQVGRALASKFIMGTAMSYSKKGSPLDVVLHRCNVINTQPTDAELAAKAAAEKEAKEAKEAAEALAATRAAAGGATGDGLSSSSSSSSSSKRSRKKM